MHPYSGLGFDEFSSPMAESEAFITVVAIEVGFSRIKPSKP
jgi:hypothetical protein